MTLLVAYASSHGSTRGVAERLASRLRDHGHEVSLKAIGSVDTGNSYQGYILGSAIYAGSWIAEAVTFIEQQRDLLAQRPVWLFSVGPLDDQGGLLKSVEWPKAKQVDGLRTLIAARDHRMFAGAIRPDQLSFLVRLIFRVTGGRYGDFRKWDEIDRWADEIASQLADNSVNGER